MKQIAESILKSFQNSGKTHLFLTGKRGIGKSTMLQWLRDALLEEYTMPGITSYLVPNSCVMIRENITGKEAKIGEYDTSSLQYKMPMRTVSEGFFSLGIPALKRAKESACKWVCVDELGFLESRETAFQEAILDVLESKRVLGVLRKQEIPFLQKIRHRQDVYLVDLDTYMPKLGCVIMASGRSVRFGKNKLLERFLGKSLIQRILDTTGEDFFERRVVVTRSKEVETLCKEQQIEVIYHAYPNRNDTVRLGIERMEGMDGCMFCPSDQPFLQRESLKRLRYAFYKEKKGMYRLAYDKLQGTPIVFGREYFEELSNLPEKCGGGYLVRKYKEQVRLVFSVEEKELYDIDTKEDWERLESMGRD